MKRILAILLGLCLLAPAMAETEQPESQIAYVLDYDHEALANWNAREHLETPGTVLALYCEAVAADAIVTLVPREQAANAADLLLLRTLSNADAVQPQESVGPAAWSAPWGADGASMELAYVYASGSYVSELFHEKAFAAPINDAYYLSIVVTARNSDSAEVIAAFEEAFFTGGLNLRALQFTEKIYGYLREARAADDVLSLSFDTFIVEDGDEANEIFIYNNDPSLSRLPVAPEANLWFLSLTRLFVWERMPHDAAQISRHISDTVLENGEYPAFLLYLNGSEIVWMEQQPNF